MGEEAISNSLIYIEMKPFRLPHGSACSLAMTGIGVFQQHTVLYISEFGSCGQIRISLRGGNILQREI